MLEDFVECLPSDLTFYIFSCLDDEEDIIRATAVSRLWRQFILSSSIGHKNLLKDFDDPFWTLKNESFLIRMLQLVASCLFRDLSTSDRVELTCKYVSVYMSLPNMKYSLVRVRERVVHLRKRFFKFEELIRRDEVEFDVEKNVLNVSDADFDKLVKESALNKHLLTRGPLYYATLKFIFKDKNAFPLRSKFIDDDEESTQ